MQWHNFGTQRDNQQFKKMKTLIIALSTIVSMSMNNMDLTETITDKLFSSEEIFYSESDYEEKSDLLAATSLISLDFVEPSYELKVQAVRYENEIIPFVQLPELRIIAEK